NISLKILSKEPIWQYNDYILSTIDVHLHAHSKEEYDDFDILIDNQISTLSETSLVYENLLIEFESWKKVYNIQLISSTISDLEINTSVYSIKEYVLHEL